MTLSKRILKSNNKSETTWNIINELLGKQRPSTLDYHRRETFKKPT